MAEKVIVTRDDVVFVIEYSEHWDAPGDEQGAARAQLYGRGGMVELMLAPSDLALIGALAETAAAVAAAEKLRRSAESPPVPVGTAVPAQFPGFIGNPGPPVQPAASGPPPYRWPSALGRKPL